jgi:hypothetical protein
MAKYFEIRINGKEIGGPFVIKKKKGNEKKYIIQVLKLISYLGHICCCM